MWRRCLLLMQLLQWQVDSRRVSNVVGCWSSPDRTVATAARPCDAGRRGQQRLSWRGGYISWCVTISRLGCSDDQVCILHVVHFQQQLQYQQHRVSISIIASFIVNRLCYVLLIYVLLFPVIFFKFLVSCGRLSWLPLSLERTWNISVTNRVIKLGYIEIILKSINQV